MVFDIIENIILHQPFESKKHHFFISEKSKTKFFPYSANMLLYAKERVILHGFVGSKMIVFPISKQFRTRPFPYSLNIVFYAKTRAYDLIAF